MSLGVVADDEGYFDELKYIIVAAFLSECLDGALHIYAIGYARLHRELLGKLIGQAVSELERQSGVVVE